MVSEENKETLFVRYRHGAENRIENNLKRIIEEFSIAYENERNPDAVFKELIQPISEGMGYGISIGSTWFRLIEEVVNIYKKNPWVGTFNLDILIQLFHILIKGDTIDKIWEQAKHLILKNIDQFSVWDFSYNKRLSEGYKTTRDEYGRYFSEFDGHVCECHGIKTLEEEKFDYIMSSALVEYGAITRLLKFVSIFFISEDYKINYGNYPKSLIVILPESDTHCWFLHWRWNLRRLYGYSKSGWRPTLNYCDADWLVSDLLASYSDKYLEEYPVSIFDHPEDACITEFERAFTGFSFQLSYALDTNLRIGDQQESYFEFRGRTIRWINGTAYTRAIVVIPTNNISNMQEDVDLANEFISAIVWRTQVPIRIVFGAGSAMRFIPIVSPQKVISGINIDISRENIDQPGISNRQILALAFYKEGINSTSIYYSTLNYYKIIELRFKGVKNDIINWINQNSEYLDQIGYREKIVKINELGGDLGNYIYVSCRCAVAHAGQIDSIISPDKNEDYIRISQVIDMIKELAKKIINEGIPDE